MVAPARKPDSAENDLLFELRDLLQAESITKGSEGQFTLASGAKSNYYCNSKTVLLSPRGSWLVGSIFHGLVTASQAEAVGGLAMGAAYIATAISCVSESVGSPLFGFTVREKKKEHGLEQSIDESFHPSGEPLLCRGRRVAVVDDVVTRGGSILKAVKAVQALGCEITAVIALVDRNEGGGQLLRDEGLPYFSVFDTDRQGNLHVSDATSIGQASSRPRPAY